MTSISPEKSAAAFCLALVMVACLPSNEASREQSGPIVGPFVVSDIYTPSGFMGDGAIPGRMTIGINENCKMPRPPGAQGDCYHFLYKIGDVRWAGCDWVYPTNSWGTVHGRTLIGPNDMGPDPVHPGKELRGYNHVRFFASVDMRGLTTEPSFDYWVGRLDGRTATPPQPFYDTGCSVFPMTPPMCLDTTDPMKPVPFAFAPIKTTDTLHGDWTAYSFDLSKWSVDQVIGGFGWAANDNENVGQTLSIYFDDIVWE